MNIKKLDKIFSEYIRRRDADENGYVKCCTCPTVSHWKEMDCGHWMLRGNKGTRFDERNCHAQCRTCNTHEDGMYDEHSSYIMHKHGLNALSDLVYNARHESHFMQHEIDELVEIYKQKINNL